MTLKERLIEAFEDGLEYAVSVATGIIKAALIAIVAIPLLLIIGWFINWFSRWFYNLLF